MLNYKVIEGFTNQISFFPGETIEFKINSFSDFSMVISKIEMPQQPMLKINNIKGKKQPLNNSPFLGVKWETVHSLQIPDNWTSGIYSAEINDGNNRSFMFFIIKGHRRDLAVLASTHTWQAYNWWGNACFYNLDQCKQAKSVSYDRPMLSTLPKSIDSLIKEKPFGNKHIMNLERLLFQWLNGKYEYDVIAETDLTQKLASYGTLVIGCHSEYWSDKMYNALEYFLGTGGKLICLGGNCIYWRVTEGDRFIQCDKAKHETWRRLGRPEAAIFGAQYTDTDYRSTGSYQLRADKHWIFKDTGLVQGDLFGKHASGWETDKTCLDTPDGTILLAKGVNKNGGAEMVYRDNVFSVSSITYTTALGEKPVSQLTKNVFDHFLSTR